MEKHLNVNVSHNIILSGYTVEPLNNGHIGTDHFVHYREVVLFRRQKCTYCHNIGWCIRKCPLYRGVLYSECPLSEVPLNTDYSEMHQPLHLIPASIGTHILTCTEVVPSVY